MYAREAPLRFWNGLLHEYDYWNVEYMTRFVRREHIIDKTGN